MRWSPSGAVAVVTGASSGIGHCLSRELLRGGASVVAVARRKDPLLQLFHTDGVEESDGELVPVAGDITDASTRQRIVEAAAGLRGGRVDLLVNNAGIGAIGTFVEATPQRLRRVMEVNFFASAELTRAMIPLLQRGHAPVICNISSVLGHCAVPGKSEYCASKFALHGWSDSLRAELAADGIQVTLVSPSTTKSEFFDSLIETGDEQTSRSFGSWTPEKVAQQAFRAIRFRRREVILSLGGKALVYADRFAPSLVAAALARSFKSHPRPRRSDG
jgi:short-subunit dehydrogenase